MTTPEISENKLLGGTKAKTLAQLRSLVCKSQILHQVDTTLKEWKEKPHSFLREISNHFGSAAVIVRSSAISEDGWNRLVAGKFKSILNVSAKNLQELHQAIEDVFASYDSQDAAHEVLIQPMLENVAMSGVVFARELETSAPYYVINYDDTTRRTDTVTSGRGANIKTWVHSRFRPKETAPARFQKILEGVHELERLLGSDRLDVEFALTQNGDLFLLQVRPLPEETSSLSSISDVEMEQHLQQIHQKITELSGPNPYLLGKKSVFGVMPDWNPAEIIGVRPRRLALTLYKELVTDNIWGYQRANYGYRNLRSFPLMISLGGLPYIDVRVSFNSFVPADIENETAERLVGWYVDRLVSMPTSHDKVEFDIVFSCYTFDLDARLALLEGTFSHSELENFRSSLRRLTSRIIHPESGLYLSDLHKFPLLEPRREAILKSSMNSIGKIYWLLEDCKRYGTLPFAGLARAAFIAVQMLRSLVSSKILQPEELNEYLTSLNTVSKCLKNDVAGLRGGEFKLEEFLKKYGHLRPGTYDILSKRYDEDPLRYFGNMTTESLPTPEVSDFKFSNRTLTRISQELSRHGITTDAVGLFKFIREAIEGRELSKFIFTKNLSDVLQRISQLGQSLDISDDDLSHLDIVSVMKLYSSIPLSDLRSVLMQNIEEGKALHQVTRRLKMKPLLCHPDDIFSFGLEEETPNYVSQGRVTAETISGSGIDARNVARRIVFIESADPGYDWIFANGIVGLVTMYGGSNSHMAIRASELGIPGVIGCGEKLYRFWSQAKVLEIDADHHQVRVIR